MFKKEKCTRYSSDTGKCTAFNSQYFCEERKNCYVKRIIKLQEKNKTLKQALLDIKEIAGRNRAFLISNEILKICEVLNENF